MSRRVNKIEENKEEAYDSSLGHFSISDISSKKSTVKKSDKSGAVDQTAKVTNLAKEYEKLEDLKLENELFTVLTYDIQNKKFKGSATQSKALRVMKATLRPCKEDFKSLPIQFTVTLKHSWHRTLMDPGDIVRIVGVFSQENQFHLSLDDLPLEHPQDPEKKRTDKGRYLVLEPDILIPSTGISTAYP